MYNTSEKWKKQIYKNIQSVLNIYIDGVLINPDYILDFKVGQTLFDEELTLGSVTSKYIELKIYKDKVYEGMKNVKVDYGILINNSLTVAEVNSMLVGTLNGIKVKSLSGNNTSYEIIPIGNFNIDDFTDNDDNTLTLKCIDNMSKFEFNYDGSKLKYPATLLQVLKDICSKAGVELGSTSFLNSNKGIAVYDNTVSAREYLSYIAESAGGFAFIGRDGKLYIRSIYQDEQKIALELFGSYKWGEEYKISKVSYEDGIRSFKFGNETDNTLWINQENMFIVDEEQVKNIYNQVKDLTTNSFEGKVIIDPALDVGDKLIIDGKPVIYQGEANFETRFIADIKNKISIKQKQETTVKKESQKVVNRRVQSRIDQAEGKITQLVEETTEQSKKITEVEQTVDGISQKVENIQDFTKEKTQIENLCLTDIAEGEGYILKLIVYGNTVLFKSKNITICASAHQRGYGESIYLQTESREDLLTEDGQEFVIGEGSYYLKSLKITLDDYLRNLTEDGKEYFDTLEIEQDGTIKVVRRIGVNSQGELYVLTKEQETILEEKIILPSQKEQTYYFINEVSGLNYYAQYIIENDYSKTFLTKLELGTKIEQNAEAVKVAWNQISEFIQMMVINNNASLAILNKDNKVMMSLDKNGQHFFNENGEDIFGEMGVEQEGEQNYISFAVDGEYGETSENGMAWGIKTKSDGVFHPIFYIKDFEMGSKASENAGGNLVLTACNLVLEGLGKGIVSGGIKIFGDPGGDKLYFEDTESNQNLMVIDIGNNITTYATINILDKISFFRNQAGSNSFKIGEDNNFVLFTDNGDISAKGGDFAINTQLAYFYGGSLMVADGNVYANNISSDRRIKDNIKDSEVRALDIVKKIQHRQFYKKTDDKHYNIGYIAQELEEIDPNFVLISPKTARNDEMYYVNELPIIATLSKAIQEQQEEMESMKETINSLQEQIKKLGGI
jgi:hypothetical protein